MPKPRGNNNNKWYSHDMRSKRVSFKQTRGGGGGRGADGFDRKNAVRNFENYEDSGIDLGGMTTARGNNMPRKNFRGNRFRPSSPAPQKRLFNSPLSWYRVTMPFGGKYEKMSLLKKLLEHVAPLPLMPFMWTNDGKSAYFYVDDFRLADKLCMLSKEIEMHDGFKLVIRVSPESPSVDVNEHMREKMKQVMSKRFNPATKALDLTKFHADPDLADTFCPLFKAAVSLAAVNIIAENIPELEALNLSDNNIQVINHLKDLPKKMPNLKVLHLARNKLKTLNHLDPFTGLPLVELILDGNQVCDNYKDQATYISEIRKRFPNIISLDGVELPAPISFDVEEIKIPPIKSTFLCSDGGQVLVRDFLASFFEIMDSGSRQPLLQAYHENAIMSMTMAYAYNQHPKNTPPLTWYAVDNRNLERLTDAERRRKLLKQGHLAIVAFYQEMPQTKHDFNSFQVDLTMFTPQMVVLNVTGLFKETRTGRKNSPVRYFIRTFVIVPVASSFSIVNEMMHISNATEDQVAGAFKTEVITSAPSTAVSPVPVVPQTSSEDMARQQIRQALMMATGLNMEWADKCLNETNWEYNRAHFAFTEAKNQGLIPASAFLDLSKR